MPIKYSAKDLDIIYSALVDKLDYAEHVDSEFAATINEVLIKTQRISETNRLSLMCEAIDVANHLFEKATNGKYHILWKTKYDEIRFEYENDWLYIYDYETETVLVDNRTLFLQCLAAAVSRYPEVAGEILQEALFGTLELNFPGTENNLVKYMEQNILPKDRRLSMYGDEIK